MAALDLILLVAGALLVVLDVFSETLRRLWLSVPLVALGAGIVLGPDVLGVVEPAELGEPKKILEGLARASLALAVLDLALRLDRATLAGLWRSILRLLLGGMVLMWLLSGLLAWAVLGVPFWVGMLIGAIVTPTDPVVASAITSEALARRNLPLALRRLLQAESGANDGLAIVLFLLPALILSRPDGEVVAWLATAAVEVAVAAGGGLLVGVLAALATNYSLRHKDVQAPLLVGVTTGVALVTLGGSHLLEGSGILAAFIGGLCFSLTVDADARERLEDLQSTVANLLVPPTFAFFGMVLPFAGWAGLGVTGVAFALALLVVRRPPAVAAALAGSGVAVRDRVFLGWFGPLGVAAMYYAVLAETYAIPEKETVFAATTLAIVVSVAAHGISATPAVRRYAGRSALEPLRHPLRGAGDAGDAADQEDTLGPASSGRRGA